MDVLIDVAMAIGIAFAIFGVFVFFMERNDYPSFKDSFRKSLEYEKNL